MTWGDFLEVTGPLNREDFELLTSQAMESFPILEGFSFDKPYRIGWYINQPIGEEYLAQKV